MYMLVLSLAPCSDTMECQEPVQTNIASYTSHENHSHEAEMCSPFCICACCGSLISFAEPSASLNYLNFASLETRPIYNSILPLEVHFAIWQPPKIG